MRLERFPGLDDYSRVALRRLASHWRDSPARPAVPGEIALRWHARILEWVHEPTAPLLVERGRGNRGTAIQHRKSGRVVVPVDDAPAIYIVTAALENRILELDELTRRLQAGQMPVARQLRQLERSCAQFQGTLESMDLPNLTTLGYSIRHVTHVSLRQGDLQDLTEVELIAHSILLLSPINIFVVPKAYSAIAAMPEFVEEMDDARTFQLARC